MARPGRLREKAILRGRERVDARRASRNRENYMSTPGRFKRDDIDTDQRRGFFGDLAQMGRDLSGPVKDSGFVKNVSQMGRDLIVDPLKKYSPGIFGGIQRGLGSLTNNWQQNEENERILGDAYSDKVRKEMMSPTDRAFYEKYMRIGDSKSGQEADYYYDEARKALENAQTTRRVNYALGDLGFDTSATAGVANVDYGSLPGNLQRGLEGTDAGEAFLRKHAVPKKGDTPEITEAIKNFYGGRGETFDPRSRTPAYTPGDKEDITSTVLPGAEYGVELPPYSDAPTSILEDYGESDVGLIGPGPLAGYTDRDLEEEELFDERLSELMNPYTNYNPLGTPYVPMENPPEEPWYNWLKGNWPTY